MKRDTNITDTAAAKAAISDIEVFGNPDVWQLICKAGSKSQGWFHSTKAMQVAGGVVVQTSSLQGGQMSQALAFIPGAAVVEIHDEAGKLIGRLVQ